MQDLRLAVRTLKATPVVTTVAILSLALGIGANTAVFSLVNTLFLTSLPVSEPEQLVLLTTGAGDERQQYSHVTVEAIRSQSAAFDGVCAWAYPGRGTFSTGAEGRIVDRQFVSGDYFTRLGVRPWLGRLITLADDTVGGGRDGVVGVISYAFWRQQFGGSPAAIGIHALFDRVPFTIVGVTPPEFRGVIVGRSFDVAFPTRTQPILMPATPYPDDGPWLRIMLRLRPGQSLDEATAAIRAAQPSIRAASMPKDVQAPHTYLKDPFRLERAGSGASPLRERFERPLLVLFAVVGLVLLIACANIANLMLGRGATRRHELAVRLALGASRWRLARQLLAESAVLSVAGGIAGLVFAAWARGTIVGRLSTFMMPIALTISTDWRVLAFTTAIMTATTVLFGLVPAILAGRVAPAATLQAADRQLGRRRDSGLSAVLIVGQVGASLTLVVVATLLVRSFVNLVTAPLGFERDRALVVTVNAPTVRAVQRGSLYRNLVEAARAVSGVAAAGGSMNPPIAGPLIGNFVVSEPGVTPPPDAEPFSQSDQITSGFLAAYGMHLQAGRDFRDGEGRADDTAIIVNDTFVKRYVRDGAAIGRSLALTYRTASQGDFLLGTKTIVGVVSDSVYRSVRDPLRPTLFLPLSIDEPILQSDFYIVVRAAGGSPLVLARSLSTALLAVNHDLTVTSRSISEQVDAVLAQDRLVASLAAGFGVIAVALAALGLYGVAAYSVARRRTEIGIRMALGAAPASIVRLVLSRVAVLVAFGVLSGAVLSVWASRFVAAMMYGLEPNDPVTLMVSATVLAITAAFAAWLPARRASRIDPAQVLRDS